MTKSKKTLAERAQLCRDMAASHRRLAASTLGRAEQMEKDARSLDNGIDPFKCVYCGAHVWGGFRFRCEEHRSES